MKSLNMIIGKRQIILASLVLGLGIAVYLNWQYASANLELPVVGGDEEQADTFGEAQFVEAQPDSVFEPEGGTLLVEAKMSRQKARDEAAETLANMLKDSALNDDQKAELAMQATELAASIETEGKIENLIKAKGFDDVMVYYDTKRADVVVKTAGLLTNEAAQIKDIILSETAVEPENIVIVEIN